MDLSVVIPLYNEEESLPELVAWIDRVATPAGYEHEIIMVDDGSKDRSWEIVEALKKQFPAIRGIRFQRNYGKSAALHVGFQAAKGDVVITMDADMQDSPDEIPELVDMIMNQGFDLVSGWKKERHDPFSKTFPSKFFNALTRWSSGIKLNDFNCGLKAYKNQVVKSIEVYGEMHRYIPVIAKWAGFSNIGEKVVEHRAREYGVTKFGGLDRGVKGMLDLVSITFTQKYMKRPMHFFGAWGALFAFIGGAEMMWLLLRKIFWEEGLTEHIPGMIFGSTALLSGLLLFSVGLLGEMIGRTAADRNDYLISETLV
ncbi:MAG: glycosyltransferase family 2 protein [Bacteroidia bacterium]